MKKILLLVLLAFSVCTAADTTQTYMLLPIVEVHDGDTIKTDLSWRLPAPLNLINIRVRGIDTPEMPADSYATTGKLNRAKCVKEAELALQARAFVIKIAEGQTRMKVSNFGWDKYARIDADVSIGGKDIGTELIKAGFAVPYDGGTKVHDWCL